MHHTGYIEQPNDGDNYEDNQDNRVERRWYQRKQVIVNQQKSNDAD
jgi:hypothetical protein